LSQENINPAPEDMERDEVGLRPIKIERNILRYAEGSALIEMGNTMVLCAATVLDSVPGWLKGSGEGWIKAEYSLLPRATNVRKPRERTSSRPDSRSIEISRMIGRSLRACIDRQLLGENTIIIDCDVLQADGGTRTAAITGGFVALYDAIRFMNENRLINNWPIKEFIAAVSVGIIEGKIVLDLSYDEDSVAEVDMNVVMTESGKLVEIQGTAEKRTFSTQLLNQMIETAWKGISKIITIQKEVLNLKVNSIFGDPI